MIVFIRYNSKMKKVYNSKQWKKLREYVLRRDQYMCQHCKRYGRTTEGETIHHILPVQDYPHYRFLSNNLITLCKKCHNEMHDRTSHELTETGKEYARRLRLELRKIKEEQE